jgi:hypothetical protein
MAFAVVADDEATHGNFVGLGGGSPGTPDRSKNVARTFFVRSVVRIDGMASALAPASNVNATTRALVRIRVESTPSNEDGSAGGAAGTHACDTPTTRRCDAGGTTAHCPCLARSTRRPKTASRSRIRSAGVSES